jgi:hypothetical protein
MEPEKTALFRARLYQNYHRQLPIRQCLTWKGPRWKCPVSVGIVFAGVLDAVIFFIATAMDHKNFWYDQLRPEKFLVVK